METREELNLSGSAQRLYEPAIFDSIPRRFASEESDASRAEADLAGIFFSKTSRQTLVERAERVDAAEVTLGLLAIGQMSGKLIKLWVCGYFCRAQALRHPG
jgi:hypothetical protein